VRLHRRWASQVLERDRGAARKKRLPRCPLPLIMRSMTLRFAVAAILVAGLGGCSHPSSTSPSPTVATVGGQSISTALRDYYVERQTGVTPDKVDPNLQKRLAADLIALAAAADAGAKLENPSVQPALELSRLQILAKAAADASGVNNPPTEADIEEAYKAYVAGVTAHEYHIAQILVPSEAIAAGLITRLDREEKFGDLARASSVDESRNRGGDLGWVPVTHYPPAFANAVLQLRVGEYTHQPVQTRYGWHVIRLLEMRTPDAPPLESVRAQLIANIKAERYRKFLDDSVHRVAVRLPTS
jgi:peptidyl-prolyl cis-trans isomerase C